MLYDFIVYLINDLFDLDHDPSNFFQARLKKGNAMKFDHSIDYFKRAQEVMPGGVSSPVRAFKNVDHPPPLIASAKGSKVQDIDNNKYIDYVGSWGTAILGHAHPDVVAAIQETAKLGLSLRFEQ